MEWTSACVMKRRGTVAFLIDVKTDLAESWQTICAAAGKMPYLICSACELMLEAVIHAV